jgi:hypothetical protein
MTQTLAHRAQTPLDHVHDVLDISDKVTSVAVICAGLTSPVQAFTDGLHYYFDDDATARVGAQLTGRRDLAGRLVRVQRNAVGWEEHRNRVVRQLHRRHIDGRTVFRFDEEWLFTAIAPAVSSAGGLGDQRDGAEHLGLLAERTGNDRDRVLA